MVPWLGEPSTLTTPQLLALPAQNMNMLLAVSGKMRWLVDADVALKPTSHPLPILSKDLNSEHVLIQHNLITEIGRTAFEQLAYLHHFLFKSVGSASLEVL